MISTVYIYWGKTIPFFVDSLRDNRLRWSIKLEDFIDIQEPIGGMMQNGPWLVLGTRRGITVLDNLWGTPENDWIVRRMVDR